MGAGGEAGGIEKDGVTEKKGRDQQGDTEKDSRTGGQTDVLAHRAEDSSRPPSKQAAQSHCPSSGHRPASAPGSGASDNR